MKYLFIFGTRPEAIKMIPLILESKKRNIPYDICVTGQHSMVLDILKTFNIVADYNLKIMKKNQTLNWIISATIQKLNQVIDFKKYTYCFVHGDTSSALASAIASFNNNLKVIHIEAGLRSGDKRDPFPEEMNRILIDQIADIHFAPTQNNRNNLLKEGVDSKNIYITGNTIIDIMLNILDSKNVIEKNEILFTCHRRENINHLDIIFDAINTIACNYPNYKITYPMHPNEKIRKQAKLLLKNKNITLIEPLDYKNFVTRLATCKLIITDSGGVLEESSFLQKRTLIIRNSLERNELLSSYIIRSDINKTKIVNSFEQLINTTINKKINNNILGDGKSAKKIFDILLKQNKQIYKLAK